MEIEIKLALDPGAVRKLSRHPAIGQSQAVHQRLLSVYYDTADFALLREGLALRLRRVGRHWVQTVKARAGSGGVLAQRPEWEIHLKSKQPNLDALPEEARALFPDVANKSLVPIFETVFRRSIWQVKTADHAIEVALDQGEIHAGDKTWPICEVELELKSGGLDELFRLADRLAADLPLRLEPRSKATRGYQLAGALSLAPVKAVVPAFDLEAPAGAAYCAIVRACLAQFEANLPGYWAGGASPHPEYVHQMRVALRRMRAAIGLLRFMDLETPAWVSELKWIMGELSLARDWDVFVTETLARIAAGLERPQALEPLAAVAQRLREAANANAARALNDSRLARLWLTLERALAEFPDTPITARQWAEAALERRYQKLRKLGKRLDELDPTERHALRIAGKKLRYAAEFFAAIKPKAARRFIDRLAHLQDILGVLNDVAVTTRLLDEAKQAGGTAVWEGAGMVAGYLAREQSERLDDLYKAWRDFNATSPYWR